MKKTIVVLVALALVLSSAFAQAAAESQTTAKQGSVYWLNFKPEADATFQEIAAAYTAETGVPVKVVTAASGEYSTTLTAEMDKSTPPTLFVIGNDGAVRTWGEYAYDLTGTKVANELTTAAYNHYDENGKLCSIGYCYESFGIIVNKELLAKASYAVEDIKDFASLKAIVEDIHARAAELGFDAFTSSGMDGSSSWRFSGHLANVALYYEARDDGWTDGPQPAKITGKYLGNFKNLWDLYINNSAYAPNSLATGGYDAKNEFGTKKAVFYQNGSWEYESLVKDYGLDPENLTMIPFYCGVEGEEMAGLNCGTENCWAVNAKASQEDIEATLDFMYWMVTSKTGTELLVRTLGAIPYKQAPVSDNVFLKAASEYDKKGNYVMAWAFNYTPAVDDWRAGVVSAMNQYDNAPSAETWKLVETAFVQGWATQYANEH